MFFSVIIPVLNGKKYIRKCFEAIKGVNTPKTEFEVILVDNGSKDETLEIAKQFSNEFKLEILHKTPGKISSLRNYGASNAQGEILVFLDIDCIVSKEWLNNGREAFLKSEQKVGKYEITAITGAPYTIPEDSSWVAEAWNLNSSNIQSEGETKWLPSGNIFVKKGVFLELGGFDESLETNEDFDLCYRCRELGYKIFLDPAIFVIHLGAPQTLKEFFRKELWHGKDVFKVFLKSGTKLKNIKAVIFSFSYLLLLLAIIFSIYQGYSKNSFLITYILIFVFLGFPVFLAFLITWKQRQFKYMFGLGILLLTYGIARAVCVLNFNWLRLEQ